MTPAAAAFAAAVLWAAAAAQSISSGDLAALSPATLAWVSSDVERHTMSSYSTTIYPVASRVAVILSRGPIVLYAPLSGSETHMPVPPGFASSKYIDVRTCAVARGSTGNEVVALLDSGAIVIARSAINTPDGRVFSPLGVIDGSFVEVAFTAGVACAVRADGAIQCFSIPSVDTAPMTAAGWRNVTAVLGAAPSALCGPLGPTACMSPPGVPFRSVSIAYGGATANMIVCAIQVNSSLPYCFGGDAYAAQLPAMQPAFVLPSWYRGLPVAALQVMFIDSAFGTDMGTMLWAKTLNGSNVGEWLYSITGPTDMSANWEAAGCQRVRGRGAIGSGWDSYVVAGLGCLAAGGVPAAVGYGGSHADRFVKRVAGISQYEHHFSNDFVVSSTLEAFLDRHTNWVSGLLSAPINGGRLAALRGMEVFCYVESYTDVISFPTRLSSTIERVRCHGSEVPVRDGRFLPAPLQLDSDSIPFSPPAGNVTALAGGSAMFCAALTTGAVWCWDDGAATSLAQVIAQPAFPSNVAARASVLAVGSAFVCAIRASDDSVACKLAPTSNLTAAMVDLLTGLPFREIAAGDAFLCGELMNSSVVCLGPGVNTSLAQHGMAQAAMLPALAVLTRGAGIVTFAGPVANLTCGASFCCMRTADTLTAACLSLNGSSILPPAAPVAVIAAGARHACAVLATDWSIVCGGNDTFAQSSAPSAPGAAAALGAPRSLVLTAGGTCAFNDAGAHICWGALRKYWDSVAPPLPVISRLNATSDNVWFVDPVAANGTSCAAGAGRRCATLNQTVAAVGRTGVGTIILVIGATSSPPVVVPATAPPMFIVGATADAAVNITAPAGLPVQAASGLSGLAVESDFFVLARLALLTTVPAWTTAVTFGGNMVTLHSVSFVGWNASRALIAAQPGATLSASPATAGSYPSLSLQNVSFSGTAAPVWVLVSSHGHVLVNGTVATAAASASSAFCLCVACGRVELVNSTIAGFQSRQLVAPLQRTTLSYGIAPLALAGGLTVVSTTSVTIGSVVFRDVGAAAAGGALHHPSAGSMDAALSVVNSTFSNTIGGSSGGAVSWLLQRSVGIVSFAGCVFFNSSSAVDGGAVAAVGAAITSFASVTVDSSTAVRDGGAIFVQQTSAVFADRVIVARSSARGRGGCVALVDVASSSVSGGVLRNCTSGSDGGAWATVVTDEARGSTHASVFQGSRLEAASSTTGNGGCLSFSYAGRARTLAVSLQLQATSVRGCAASAGMGGAVAVATGLAYGLHHVVSVLSSNVSDSNALSGGCLAVDAAASTSTAFTVAASSLSSCVATADGGAISASGFAITLSQSTITGNSAGGSGGGVFAVQSSVAVTAGIISNNSAASVGGGISVSSCMKAGLVLAAAQNASFVTAPPGQAWLAGQAAAGTLTVLERNRAAAGHGGAVAAYACSVALSRVVAWNNSAGTDGGAIAVRQVLNNGRVCLQQLVAVSNSAISGDGGVLHVLDSAAPITVGGACSADTGTCDAGQPWSLWLQAVLSNSTASPLAAAAAQAGPIAWAFAQQPSNGGACVNSVLIGSTAVNGGDVAAVQSNTAGGTVYVSGVASALSVAARGGSVFIQNVGSATILSGAAVATTARIAGGAVYLQNVLNGRVASVSFANVTAPRGGALAFERVASTAAARISLSAAQLTLGSLSLANCTFAGVRAAAGGCQYAEYGPPAMCESCLGVNSCAATVFGATAASSPRRIAFMSSSYEIPPASIGGLGVGPAVGVVPSVATAQPLALLNVTDALGQLVADDNATVCTLSGTRLDSGAPVPFGVQAVYTAVRGIVPLFPFSTQLGTRVNATISVSCANTAFGGTFDALSFGLQTTAVELVWAPATVAASRSGSALRMLPSSALQLYVASEPIVVQLADAQGQPISGVSAECSLSLASAFDSRGQASTATLLNAAVRAVDGKATFWPSIRADANVTAWLSAACTWISGDRVETQTTLPAALADIRAMAAVGPVDACAPPPAFGAANASTAARAVGAALVARCSAPSTNVSASERTATARAGRVAGEAVRAVPGCQQCYLAGVAADSALQVVHADSLAGMAAPTMVLVPALDGSVPELQQLAPTALPGAVDSDAVQPFHPPPTFALLDVTAASNTSSGDGAALLTGDDTALVCRLALQRSAADGGGTVQAVGRSSVQLAGGYAVFDQAGGAGSQLLGKSIALSTSCSWVSGETLTSAPTAASFLNLTARWVQDAPPTAIPSTALLPSPLHPAPVAVVEAVAADGRRTAPPLPVAAVISVVQLAPGAWADAGTMRLALAGGFTTIAALAAAGTGLLNTTGLLPVTGAFGAVGCVATSFTWMNGDAFVLRSSPVSLFNLTAAWLQPPPAALLPASQQFMRPIAAGPIAVLTAVDAYGASLGAPPAAVAATVTVVELAPGTWSDGGTARIVSAGGSNAVAATTAEHSGVLDLSNLVVVGGSFGATLRLVVTFRWLTGEPLVLQSAPIALSAPTLNWTHLLTPIRYGDSYDIEVCLSIGNVPGVELDVADLSCTLSSGYVSGGSGVLPMAGAAIATFGNVSRPCGTFSGVSWAPAQPSNASAPATVVSFTADCTARGQPLRAASGSSYVATAVVAKLAVAWRVRPPAIVQPSASDPVTTWGAVAAVTIVDDDGAPLPNSTRATCTLSVDDAGGFTQASDAAACTGPGKDVGLCSRLVGTRVATLEGASAAFDGVGIDAPLGSWAVIRAACVRSVGGIVLPALANVTVSPVLIEWQQGVSATRETGVLYNTPIAVSARVTKLAADGTTWLPVTPVMCSIAATGGAATMSDAAAPSGETAADGTASFLLAVTGAPGSRALVTASCTVAGRSVSGLPASIVLDSSEVEWVSRLPAVWMPSSAVTGGRNPLPAAEVRLTRVSALDHTVSRLVDTHMLRCRVSVIDGEGSILEGPPAGYVLEASATTAIDVAGGIAAAGDAAPSLPLTSIMVMRSSFAGGAVTLGVSCTRRQGDALPQLTAVVRFPAPALQWLLPPPAAVSPQQAFGASLELVDADAGLQRILLDNSTTCTLQLTSAAADTSVLIVNSGSGKADAGVVQWAGAAISARAGMTVSGTATCAFPGLPTVNATLPWSVQMIPCGPGTIAVGYGCQVCSTGTWSPGGTGATACIPCPSVGVTCSGGHVTFTPGYFRTDGSSLMPARDTVDLQTELTECLNVDACVVNATAASMAGNATHRCAEGYEGPLCSICMDGGGPYGSGFTRSGAFVCVPCTSKATTAFLVILITGAQIALIVWVAVFRTPAAEGESRGLFKVLITYVQTLGILFSFGARATESFRSMFSFSLAISASPLALPPVACAMRATFYSRWAAVVTLPLIVGVVAIAFGQFARSAFGKRFSTAMAAAQQVAGRRSSILVRRLVRMPPPATTATAGTTSSSPATTAATIDPVSSCIFVITLYLPNITTSCFNLLNCLPYKIGGIQYLAGDLSVDCNAATHKALSVLAILLIVSLGLGLPVAFAWFIRRQRDRLDCDVLRRRYGDLYTPYKPEFCFWESLVFVRTAAVVAIGSLVTGDAYMQSFAAILLFITSLVLQAMYAPYKYRVMNVVETMAQCGILLTMLTTVFYLRTSNRLALCSGQPDETMVALDKGGLTSCSTVRASATRNDLLTTLALIAINLTVVGIMAFIAARTHLLDIANAAPTPANRWRRQTAQRIARLCGCIPPQSSAAPVKPAAQVATRVGDDDSDGDIAGSMVSNPLQQARPMPAKPPAAAAAAVVVLPPLLAPEKGTDAVSDPSRQQSMQRASSAPRTSVAFAPNRVASRRELPASKEKEAFAPVANSSAKLETA